MVEGEFRIAGKEGENSCAVEQAKALHIVQEARLYTAAVGPLLHTAPELVEQDKFVE